jgi:hypothetical protein
VGAGVEVGVRRACRARHLAEGSLQGLRPLVERRAGLVRARLRDGHPLGLPGGLEGRDDLLLGRLRRPILRELGRLGDQGLDLLLQLTHHAEDVRRGASRQVRPLHPGA